MINKVTLTLLLAVLMQLLTYSQDRAGKFLIGGSFGLDFSNSKGEDNSATITPSGTTDLSTSLFGGYCFTKRIAAGIEFELNISSYDYDSDLIEYTDMKDLLVASYLRYYIVGGLFAHGQFNIGQSEFESKSNMQDPISEEIVSSISKYSYFTMGFGLGVGYDIQLKDNIYLEPMLRYILNKKHDKESDTNQTDNSLFLIIGLIFTI